SGRVLRSLALIGNGQERLDHGPVVVRLRDGLQLLDARIDSDAVRYRPRLFVVGALDLIRSRGRGRGRRRRRYVKAAREHSERGNGSNRSHHREGEERCDHKPPREVFARIAECAELRRDGEVSSWLWCCWNERRRETQG